MGEGGEAAKSHRKKTKGASLKKKNKAAAAIAKASGGTGNNPKAFIFSTRGKAKLQQRRSAEKEQRRFHGEGAFHWGAVVRWSSSPQPRFNYSEFGDGAFAPVPPSLIFERVNGRGSARGGG